MKQVCQCGTCEWCQAKQSVLEFAAQRQWAPFAWTACSTICGGEQNWKIFVKAHDLTALRWVLRVANEQEHAPA